MPRMPVDECPAGPAMDAAVAEALGVEYDKGHLGIYIWKEEDDPYETTEEYEARCLFQPSTDIAAAWEVITQAWEMGFGFTISDNANRFAAHIDCRFWALQDDMRRGIAIEGEAPLAICRAFLKANGVEFVEVPE